jgi:hypothetical protein
MVTSLGPGSVPDLAMPSAARIYDYLLEGKDHFAVDREAAQRLVAAFPEARKLARANRRFLTRAVWYLAEHGLSQYIDLGSGLPTSPNVHEVARQVRPGARVAYVDNDPVVAAHGRAMCNAADGVAFVEHDIRDPQGILTDPGLAGLIDFSAPVAVLGVSLLHFIPDQDKPREIITAFRWRMAPGSYLALSHAASDGSDERALADSAGIYEELAVSAVPRTAADILGFFTGLDLIEPGLLDVTQWRADMPEKPTKIRFLAGVGRKQRDLPRLATSRGHARPCIPGGWWRPGHLGRGRGFTRPRCPPRPPMRLGSLASATTKRRRTYEARPAV